MHLDSYVCVCVCASPMSCESGHACALACPLTLLPCACMDSCHCALACIHLRSILLAAWVSYDVEGLAHRESYNKPDAYVSAVDRYYTLLGSLGFDTASEFGSAAELEVWLNSEAGRSGERLFLCDSAFHCLCNVFKCYVSVLCRFHS